MDEMKRAALAQLEQKANRLMRGYALELTKRIKRDTPVDTGRARSNWNVSVNKPDTTAFDVGDEDRSVYSSHSTRKDAQNSTIADQTNFWRGDVGWIANGLPYILRLERGWSGQAPNGMVKVNIEGLKAWFAKQAASQGFR